MFKNVTPPNTRQDLLDFPKEGENDNEILKLK